MIRFDSPGHLMNIADSTTMLCVICIINNVSPIKHRPIYILKLQQLDAYCI